MSLLRVIDDLRSFCPTPSSGLPEELFRFITTIVPMVNVDLLIKNDFGQTLLTWRDDEFYPPGWHIPGGIIRYKETAHDRIVAVAKDELGAKVTHGQNPIAINEIIMGPEWRVRGHFISLLYECRIDSIDQELHAKDYENPSVGEYSWQGNCPDKLYAAHGIYRQYIE